MRKSNNDTAELPLKRSPGRPQSHDGEAAYPEVFTVAVPKGTVAVLDREWKRLGLSNRSIYVRQVIKREVEAIKKGQGVTP